MNEAMEAATAKAWKNSIFATTAFETDRRRRSVVRAVFEQGYQAAKAETCEWVWKQGDGEFRNIHTGCEQVLYWTVIPSGQDYCGHCGGKIVERRSDV